MIGKQHPALEQPVFEMGERVELRESLPGYPEGSRGVIAHVSRNGLMVRFENTGHLMLMRPEEILSVSDRP